MNWFSAGLIFLIPKKYVNINECVRLKRKFIEKRKEISENNQGTAMEVENSNTQDGDRINNSNDGASDDSAPARVFDVEDSWPAVAQSPKSKQVEESKEKGNKDWCIAYETRCVELIVSE